MKILLILLAATVLLILCTFALLLVRRKIHIWLPAYCRRELRKTLIRPVVDSPVHVLFCFVDHFEPGWNRADPAKQRDRVDGWVEKYPLIARDFRDADGYPPRHTWFYPPHYFSEEHILKLLSLCRQGFGEIEMHLHHSRMDPFPDTSATLKRKILDCIDLYSHYGIFKTEVDGRVALRYAFIHGDWALDNSREEYCGVNDELSILQETGCYADLTFPSYMVESQPRTVNSIYYAKDDPLKPKSYDTGKPVRVDTAAGGDGLMMIQGPLGFRWKRGGRLWRPAVDDGELALNNPPAPERVDFWIKTGIHVEGRPEWVVVKVFTHGAALAQQRVLLGEEIRLMHRHLADRCASGKICLHYVTARELYNIIKAAEDGHSGDPGLFRNYRLGPYSY